MFVRPKNRTGPETVYRKTFGIVFGLLTLLLTFHTTLLFSRSNKSLRQKKNFERSDNIPHFFQVKGSSKVNRKRLATQAKVNKQSLNWMTSQISLNFRARQAVHGADDITTPNFLTQAIYMTRCFP